MLRISILILCLRPTSGAVHLSIIKEEDGVPTIITDTVEIHKGKSLKLTCSVWQQTPIDNQTLWTKSNKTLARHILQFNRIRLKDRGAYTCSSDTIGLELCVLPKSVSEQLKREVYNLLYSVKSTQGSSSSSSSSESTEKPVKAVDLSSVYVEFWLIVFVIVMVGLGVFSVYYIVKRFWWKSCTRRRLATDSEDGGVALTELPPSYNDLPPTYDEAVNAHNPN